MFDISTSISLDDIFVVVFFVVRRPVALFTALAELCAHLAGLGDIFEVIVPQRWQAAAPHSSHLGVRTPLRTHVQ